MTGAALSPIDLRYYYEDTDRHGNVRRYFRKRIAGSKKYLKVRIRAELGSEGFHNQFAAALKGAKAQLTRATAVEKTIPNSLRWLVEKYYASAAFKELETSTRDVRRRLLDNLCQEPRLEGQPGTLGALPYNIPADKIEVLRDRKAERADAANGRLKALRGLFTYAVSDKSIPIKRNPAKEVAYLKSKKKGGFHTWTTEEVAIYLDRHGQGTKARLALGIILLSGQRRSDIVVFGKQHLREARFMPENLQVFHAGRWISFTQHKNRNKSPVLLTIPVLPELEHLLTDGPTGALTFLETQFGKPFTANGFGNWFRRRCNEAGLPHCSAHGLRKAGATIAADNGATAHQLMAIFGWTTIKQAEIYTKKADQKRLAGVATRLLVPGQFGAGAPLVLAAKNGLTS
ncbi:tyrosine-type recombinase/integrase [Bradyrhizobium sp. AUGA SZCCT0169]|uniref:tyrosine-type recombinase/integrase n=1 Tax=Bradyrhizobium sp. AUGA SZCCT0169 TaxID=2807663 RepID=UPI001BAB84AA|nr:tyrosine-type recombinase/integrase [Bradyrhizobium sp. AUGA SZCCT0169]MBR1250002.1 tyrosine-type recombinase/integrase [Bradyrhizobium sp. AUGA SZCCT0169]